MSAFYGMVKGNRGAATRGGSTKITASAQSYDGSAILELTYNESNELMVRLSIAENESSCYGTTIFYGTFKEFTSKFR